MAGGTVGTAAPHDPPRIEQRGLQLTALNMPNIDINVAGAAQEMRAYSLNLLTETVRLAGELGARGVVIGPGKANPLFPADAVELIGYFFSALDRLCSGGRKIGHRAVGREHAVRVSAGDRRSHGYAHAIRQRRGAHRL